MFKCLRILCTIEIQFFYVKYYDFYMTFWVFAINLSQDSMKQQIHSLVHLPINNFEYILLNSQFS